MQLKMSSQFPIEYTLLRRTTHSIATVLLTVLLLLNSSNSVHANNCRDIKWYEYNGRKDHTCEWVSQDKGNRCNLIDANFVEVRDRCRRTCDNCSVVGMKRATGQWCTKSSQCASGVCRQDVCYESEDCRTIQHLWGSNFDRNKIILVFVGSGFTNSEEWQQQVLTTFNAFNQFEMFGHHNSRFNALYVDILEEDFCSFGCKGIQTLLCCDLKKAKALANKCFPSHATLQTIVIHNDSKYGGAGYRDSNIATTTKHADGGLVAVHELGHSLFELGDEYQNGFFSAKNSANCDVAGCPKWSDLSEHLGMDFCAPKACKGGDYYAGQLSFMNSLEYPVGDVNLRFTCCTFLALTNGFPSYCDKFEFGEGLVSYCKRDFQNYGGAAAYQLLDPSHETEELPQYGSSYMIVTQPIVLVINVVANTFSYENVVNSQDTGPAIYRRRQMLGDYPDILSAAHAGEKELLKVTVLFDSGKKQEMLFGHFKSIHVPPSSSHFLIPLAIDDNPSHAMEIVADGNKGQVDNVEFETLTISWWKLLLAWLSRVWRDIANFFIKLFS